MRIPITKYGLPQVVVFGVVTLLVIFAVAVAGSAILPLPAFIAIEAVLFAVLVFVLAFFRDPKRQIQPDHNILLAPADGKITNIDIVDNPPHLGQKSLCIGIFLNIFDVHINRTPCAVTIDAVSYKKGRYKNAANPQSSRLNESNDIVMTRLDAPADKLLVRQISGAIARRIVCCAQVGENFTGGQKFGMIKFGSRTELYLPIHESANCVVSPGDKVKAGLTVLVRYEKCQASKTMG